MLPTRAAAQTERSEFGDVYTGWAVNTPAFFPGVGQKSDMHESPKPGVFAQPDSESRSYEELEMKTGLAYSHQTHAHAHLHAGTAALGVARPASRSRYTCPMHAKILGDVLGDCPECGMTLIPMHQAVARAAMELRSLSAVNKALRLSRI